MAKRKNPLKDLDAFLKQEATSLVTPDKITKKDTEEPLPVQSKSKNAVDTPKENHQVTAQSILADLQTLATENGSNFRTSLYDIIRQTLEQLEHSSSEDKMLINTVLYLNNKSEWKENIKNYWSKEKIG